MKIFNSNHKSYQIDSENDHIEKSGSSLQWVVLKMCHNRRVLLKNKKKVVINSYIQFSPVSKDIDNFFWNIGIL